MTPLSSTLGHSCGRALELVVGTAWLMLALAMLPVGLFALAALL